MKTIKFGSRGEEVKALQRKLGLVPDGFFGINTDAAVRFYQRSHGLTSDGIVGDHTWESLGFASVSREIDEIIIHCSATREGVPYSSSRIDAAHKKRNFSSYKNAQGEIAYIGYHFLVHLDGTIEACRPISKIGCHASGHNARSIGICYIGGLDARDINGSMTKDTRTKAQKESLISLIKQLKADYPTIKRVIGHRDTSKDLNGNGVIDPYEFIKACPCFDAIPEYQGL